MSRYVKNGRCPCCGSIPNLWNSKAIIEAARRWTKDHGEPPRAREWRMSAPDRPTRGRACEVFGTWNNMLLAAGLVPRKHGGGHCIWTKDEIAEAMLDWLFEYGRWPQLREWEKARRPGGKQRPSASAVTRRFGSWTAAKVYAGYRDDGYRSTGQCSACGCARDKRTPGCTNCRTRHHWRRLHPKRGPLGIGGVEADGTASAARATSTNQSERLTSQKTAARSDRTEDSYAA